MFKKVNACQPQILIPLGQLVKLDAQENKPVYFQALGETYYNIVINYQINTIVVEEFIDNLKLLENKYKMIPLYKNFISSLNI